MTPVQEKPPSPAGSGRGSLKDLKSPSPEVAPPPTREEEERIPSRPTSAAEAGSRQTPGMESREKTQESMQGINCYIPNSEKTCI